MDIQILLALQAFREGPGAFLTEFIHKMTFLGELNTVIVLMAVVYWAVDKELGAYLLMGWSGNRLVNGLLKVSVCAYRPWIRDARVVPYGNAMTTATGYSFPSGHTMNAATVYGGLAVRRDMPKTLRVTAGLTVALVAFSRLFLGVHTPQDVLIGALAGLLVMALVLKMMQALAEHPEKDLTVVGVGLALALGVALYAGLKTYPADYDAQGKLIVDGAKMANDTFKGVGWCAAFLLGWLLERRCVRFSTEVPTATKLTRVTVGLLCYYAVSLLLVPEIKAEIPGPAGTALSCFLQMFYVAFFFPWCFQRLEAGADRRRAVLAALLALVLLLLSCLLPAQRKQPEQATQTQTLTVSLFPWIPDYESFQDTVSACWAERRPDVELIFSDWDCYGSQAPDGVDVFVFDCASLDLFAAKGWLLPLTEADVDGYDDLIPAFVEGCRVDGTLYAVPQFLCTDFLYTRQGDAALASVRSIPALYDALPDGGLLADKDDSVSQVCLYLNALVDGQRQYLDVYPPIEAGALDEAALAVLRQIGDMRLTDPGAATDDRFYYAQRFGEGEGRAYIGYSESMDYMDASAGELDLRLFSMTEDEDIPVFYVDAAAVNAQIDPQKRELALELLNLLTGTDLMVRASARDGDPRCLLSGRVSVYDALSPDYPMYAQFKAAAMTPDARVFRIKPDGTAYLDAAEQNASLLPSLTGEAAA